MFQQVTRRAVPVGWALLGFALLYLFGVLTLREVGPIRLPGLEFAAKADLPPGIYGTEPKITQFYAGAGVLTKGEHAVVCYGVQNVQAVRLTPPVEQIKPALNRCFAVAPVKTTTYTLTAQATDGRELQESFTIQVNPAAPWFSRRWRLSPASSATATCGSATPFPVKPISPPPWGSAGR